MKRYSLIVLAVVSVLWLIFLSSGARPVVINTTPSQQPTPGNTASPPKTSVLSATDTVVSDPSQQAPPKVISRHVSTTPSTGNAQNNILTTVPSKENTGPFCDLKFADCIPGETECAISNCSRDVDLGSELSPIPSVPPPSNNPPANGGYPDVWANAGVGTILDDWGMPNRWSASYGAFKVHKDFIANKNTYDMPSWGLQGIGGVKQWPDNARNAGIPVDSTPALGAIAVFTGGAIGHVMYVEQVGTVNSQPAIFVSHYDFLGNNEFSQDWVYTSGLIFIHF